VNEGEDLSNLVNKLGADTEIIVLSKINLKYFLCSLQMELPIQYNFRETKLCFKEAIVLDNELEKLLKKGVVEIATHSEGKFISTIFLRPKKTGGYRMILNLTEYSK
jgi:hypothetical protein